MWQLAVFFGVSLVFLKGMTVALLGSEMTVVTATICAGALTMLAAAFQAATIGRIFTWAESNKEGLVGAIPLEETFLPLLAFLTMSVASSYMIVMGFDRQLYRDLFSSPYHRNDDFVWFAVMVAAPALVHYVLYLRGARAIRAVMRASG